ncbi:MAG: EAL domain-containing protein [Xanthobacteraceae bacterium]|nr:EAL domain-containing protein [Xanthobacteraceae bacterium]MBV9629946.1 EAL domain-containing protein [Xanthobacteraceae bacterium]
MAKAATEFVSGFESLLFPFRFPLAAIFNNVSQGVCLFNASARIVACNASYIDLYGLSRDIVKPGCTLIELLQHRKETGLLIEDPEQYAHQILASLKKDQVTTWLLETRAGRFIRAKNHPIAGGGWVTTHDDITDLRRAELATEAARLEAERARSEAQAAHARLLDAFDVVPEGLALFDADDRLVLWNKRYAEVYAQTTNIAAGVRFEELLRNGLAHGQYPDAIGREAEFLAERLELHGRSMSSLEQRLAGNRWVRIEGRRTADGGRIGVRIDVTDLKRREESFRLLFDANPLPMMVYDRDDFHFLAVNDAAVAHYGYSREQFLSMSAADIRPAEDRERFEEAIRSRAHLPSRGTTTWRHLKADGTPIEVQIFSCPLSYQERPAALAAIFDVTERNRIDRQLREAREFLNSIVDNLPIGLTVKRASDRKYVLINKVAGRLFDVPLDQQIGRTAGDVFPADVADFIRKGDAEALARRSEAITGQFSLQRGEGSRLYQTLRLAFGSEGMQEHILVLLEDVTDRIEAQARIAYLAHHDALTELPNRHTFELYLGAAVERARGTGESLAVLYVGLDHFKEINDLFGTAVGDAVLRAVAGRLADAAREAFTARLGGDEFAIVCTGPQPMGAEQLAANIFERLGEELTLAGHTVRIAASMGISVFPGDADTVADLIANADTAMERAKAEGRHTLRFFDNQTDRELRERRVLHHDLRFAIERNELRLDYQPLVKADRSVIGFEVLARWRHPVHGEIPPGKFIPLAEDGGVIFPISRWVLRAACREAATWSEPLSISVNLSPMQVKQGRAELIDLVRSTLAETGLDPRRLELEITESGLVGDRPRTVSILAELKSLGVRIALDDFGTGYSSLSRLKDFPLDKIKIDRSFTAGIHLNPQSGSITQSIIALGHALGLTVLAEGVETEQQLAILTSESCDQMQGYLLGRPMPIEHYAAFVRPEALDTPLAGAV